MIESLINKYKTNKSFREFVRFCIVGGICTVLDATIFYVVRLFASYQVALVCGYCLSLIVNYFLTIYWTFKKKASVKNAIGVVGAHLFNLFVVRMGLMYLFVDCMGMDDKIAYVPTLLISMVTNFIVVKFVVNRFSAACLVAFCCGLLQSCEPKTQVDENFYVYLCIGQSNMLGHSAPEAQDSIIPDRFINLASCDDSDRKCGEWRPAVPPLCRNKGGLSPADYFGRTMLEFLPDDKKVGLIVVAVNGVSILSFDKDRYENYYNSLSENWMKREIDIFGHNLYARILSLAQQAQKQGVIRGIIVHQGETDATGDEWIHNINKVYNDLLTDLHLSADSVPLLVGEAVAADQNGAYQHVNSTIDRIHDFIPSAYTVSSKGCSPREDKLHFSAEGTRTIGRRYGLKMLQLMGYDVIPDADGELQIESAPIDDSFCVNAHVREADNRLVISSVEPLSTITVVGFSGQVLSSCNADSQQTVEIDLDSLSTETHFVLNIQSVAGQVVTKNVDSIRDNNN